MRSQPHCPLVLIVAAATNALDKARSMLQGAGFEVLDARDAATALIIAREAAPDLVVIEATVTETDTSTLIQSLGSEPATKGTPVVCVDATTPSLARSSGPDEDVAIPGPFGAVDVGLLRTLADLRQAALADRTRAEELQASHQKKDEFMAMLGHELRNPLGAVRAGLSLLERGGTDEALAARVRAIMRRQTDALVRLVDDLLDVARIAHGKLRLDTAPVDLRDIVESAVEALRSEFDGKGVALSSEVSCAAAVVDGDSNRLMQVVANLLDNALKFTPRGGDVRISLGVNRLDPRRVLLRIADNGVGIDSHHLTGLFQLFFQGDTPSQARGGLGIGLSIVRRLVELHGGTVHVASDGPGLGAEFAIDLPLREDSSPSGRQTTLSTPIPGQSGMVERRVLLVDDHADSRELFHEVLRREGHAVTLASDGEQAVTTLLTETFDVAVVDIGLPGLDGYEVARLARERLGANTLLLVAMTGYGGRREREAATRAGFDLYLVKPVAPETLVDVIAKSRRAALP